MRFLFIACLLFLLCSCDNSNEQGLAQRLLQQEKTIVSLEFAQLDAGQPVMRTVINKNGTGQWIVDSLRLVNPNSFATWWNMLAALREQPLYLDDASLPAMVETLQNNGLKVSVRDKKTKPLHFYLYKFNNIGLVALVEDKTYLLSLPYDGEDVMCYWSAVSGYWQDMTVFAYLPAEIDTIRVIHRANALASFELIHEQDTVWTLKPLVEQSFNALNNNLLHRYIAYYAQVSVDSIADADNEGLKAIIMREDWDYSIKVVNRGKHSCTVQLYAILAAGGEGADTDKCLAYIVETKEIAFASWVSFDLLLKKFQDFVEKK